MFGASIPAQALLEKLSYGSVIKLVHVWEAEGVNSGLHVLLLLSQPAGTLSIMQPYLFINGILGRSVKSFEFYDSSIYLHPVEEKMHAFCKLSENVFDVHAVLLKPN